MLHAVIGMNSVSGKQDIYTVKENNHLMISLADYMLALDFPVKVNPASGTASGWMSKPTQLFSFDLKNKQVAYAEKTFAIKPGDVKQDGNDLLVSSDALEMWLGVVFDYDLSSLNLIISTPEIYPIETAYIARIRGRGAP